MKIYTREQLETLVKDIRSGKGKYQRKRQTLKDWCKDKGLYYSGIVRFFKGSEININTYSRILNAVDPANEVCTHYLSTELLYRDLKELKPFIRQLAIR